MYEVYVVLVWCVVPRFRDGGSGGGVFLLCRSPMNRCATVGNMYVSYGRGIQKGDAGFDAGSESSFSSLDQTSLCIQTSVVRERKRANCRVSLWGHDSRNTRIPYSWNFSLVPDYKNILQCHAF